MYYFGQWLYYIANMWKLTGTLIFNNYTFYLINFYFIFFYLFNLITKLINVSILLEIWKIL